MRFSFINGKYKIINKNKKRRQKLWLLCPKEKLQKQGEINAVQTSGSLMRRV
jgi:hypothetical protein